MSRIRVEKINGASDKNFRIELPSSANLLINGDYAIDPDTHWLRIPIGTTAQRPLPADSNVGDIRFNTETQIVEGWNGSSWLNLMVPTSGAGGQNTGGAQLPTRGLIIHLDANDPNSLLDQNDQDANYWYNLRSNNFHFGIPTDRISTTTINGVQRKFMDFSANGNGCAKLQNNYMDVPWYPHCSVVFFLRWRTDNSQWRTPLRSRDADHHIIVQDGTRNLGMYDNNGAGFQDTGYDIDQFPNWDSKFNMYTWRFSTYEAGAYQPNYQCFFHNEATARATLNNGNTRYNRGFHHLGAWGNGDRNPHNSSQNCGAIGVFMYYDHHLSQSERQSIYDYYRSTWDI